MIERGDIVWVDFGSPRGSEPAKVRPAVVLQANWVLDSKLNTVLVVPVTSNVAHQRFPGNVFIPKAASELEKDSVALVTQLGPVSREFIDPCPVSSLPEYLLAHIEGGVRLVTGL